MEELIELSSDTDSDRENLDEELSAILKKYENSDIACQKSDSVGVNSLVAPRSSKKSKINNDLSPSASEDELQLDFGERRPQNVISASSFGNDKVDSKTLKKLEKEEKLKQKNEERSIKLAQRLIKQEELAQARVEKRAKNEIFKSLKPEEAIKQIKCLIDNRLSNDIQSGLNEHEISCKRTEFQTRYPKITFGRENQSILTGLNGALGMNLEEERVPVLYVIEHHDLLTLARTNETLTLATDSKSSDITTLVELDPDKPQREHEKVIESSLIELQIVHGWSHRKLKSNPELIELVRQYAKAFALAPSKRIKSFNKAQIAQPPSTDCVRVNNTGHGLSTLYLRQLSQFPLASLETAHTVAKLYPTPNALIKSGEEEEVVEKLADAQVRRAIGPLSAPRRLGPQLAKKIYVAFTSTQADAII